jgi:hypothetical protein
MEIENSPIGQSINRYLSLAAELKPSVRRGEARPRRLVHAIGVHPLTKQGEAACAA